MRVAVPVWEKRVSPVFDTARRLVVVDLEDDELASRITLPLTEPFAPRRARLLRIWGVEVLICGGISPYLARLIAAYGIRVVPGVRGDAEEVLQAFRRGGIPSPAFTLPGWRAGRRRGRGGNRNAYL
jgi:predicted Fe-Mo cluster-binding NifX family protein